MIIKNKQKALSQIELIMVLTIIVISVSIGAVSITSSISGSKLRYATDQLISDLHEIKNQARRDQQQYVLQINRNNLSYNMYQSGRETTASVISIGSNRTDGLGANSTDQRSLSGHITAIDCALSDNNNDI